jgi:hypothetical protein
LLCHVFGSSLSYVQGEQDPHQKEELALLPHIILRTNKKRYQAYSTHAKG